MPVPQNLLTVVSGTAGDLAFVNAMMTANLADPRRRSVLGVDRAQAAALTDAVVRRCQRSMERHHRRFLVARQDDRPIGLAVIDKLGHRGPEIRVLLTVLDCHRQGIGRGLLARSLTWLGACPGVRMWVPECCPELTGFAARMGFLDRAQRQRRGGLDGGLHLLPPEQALKVLAGGEPDPAWPLYPPATDRLH